MSAQEISEKGCYLVKNSLPKSKIEAANHFSTQLWATYETDAHSKGDKFKRLVQEGVLFSSELWKFDKKDKTGFRPFMKDLCRQVSSSKAGAIARQYLNDETLFFFLSSCQFRKLVPGGKTVQHIGFHQDMGFMKAPFRIINIWTPLQSVGVNTPGLDLIRLPFRELLADNPRYAFPVNENNYGLRDDVVLEDFGTSLWSPQLESGDQILFDLMTLHRTGSCASANPLGRLSIELRICGASALTPDYPIQEGLLVSAKDHKPRYTKNGYENLHHSAFRRHSKGLRSIAARAVKKLF